MFCLVDALVVYISPHLPSYHFTNSYPNFEVEPGTNRSYLGLAPHQISTCLDHAFIFRLGDTLVVYISPHLPAYHFTNSYPNFEVELEPNRSYLALALH